MLLINSKSIFDSIAIEQQKAIDLKTFKIIWLSIHTLRLQFYVLSTNYVLSNILNNSCFKII